MTTKEFIEKAISGGWNGVVSHGKDIQVTFGGEILYTNLNENRVRTYGLGMILLDPKAWEAVGKVELWDSEPYIDERGFIVLDWHMKMHKMIDHLIAGGDITSYLETL